MKEPVKLPDFDTLRALAMNDPAAFEVRRRQVIDAAIAKASPQRQQRLRGLQWRIEQVRRRASTPLAACISLTDMMWAAVAGEEGLLDVLHKGPSLDRGTAETATLVCLVRRLPGD